jgi:hypothetical protein
MMMEMIANKRRRWIRTPAVLKARKPPIQIMKRTTARIRNIADTFFPTVQLHALLDKKRNNRNALPVENTGDCQA